MTAESLDRRWQAMRAPYNGDHINFRRAMQGVRAACQPNKSAISESPPSHAHRWRPANLDGNVIPSSAESNDSSHIFMKPPAPDPAFEVSLRPPAFSEFT